MRSSLPRASELRSVLAVDPPPPTVSCADIIRDGRRVVRRRRWGVALVLTTVLALLGAGTYVLLPPQRVEPAGITSTPAPPSTTSKPTVAFPPMTEKDRDWYTVLLAKQNWPPKGLTATADNGGKPGQFQVIEDFLRMGVRLTDAKGRSGTLVIVVRSSTGHPVRCVSDEDCRRDDLPRGRIRYSWSKKLEQGTVERAVLVTDSRGMQVDVAVTDSVTWPVLSGAEIAALAENLSG